MISDSEIPWELLHAERKSRGAFAARVALSGITGRILAAVDHENRRHFLLPLDADISVDEERSTRGLAVTSRELVIGNQPVAWYLDIICLDAAGYDAFDLVGRDIARLIAGGQHGAVEAVSEVLDRWRHFWSMGPRDRLSREAVLGLFGEIWFLTNWLVPAIGSAAVTRWAGPLGQRHDFQWSGYAVEAKTTGSTRGRVHLIHGLEQLAPPSNGQLYLFSLRVAEESGATNTLPGLIETCEQRLKPDAAIIDRLQQLLARVGYSPVHAAQYEEIRLRIVEEALFQVTGDFPRLTVESFSPGIPGGVEKVEYVINLNTYDHLRIARFPEEATFLQL